MAIRGHAIALLASVSVLGLASQATLAASCDETSSGVFVCKEDDSLNLPGRPDGSPVKGADARVTVSSDASVDIFGSRFSMAPGMFEPTLRTGARSTVRVGSTTIESRGGPVAIDIGTEGTLTLDDGSLVKVIYDGTSWFVPTAAISAADGSTIKVSAGSTIEVDLDNQPLMPGLGTAASGTSAIIAQNGSRVVVEGNVSANGSNMPTIGFLDTASEEGGDLAVEASGRVTSSGYMADAARFEVASGGRGPVYADIAGRVETSGQRSHGLHVLHGGTEDDVGRMSVESGGIVASSGDYSDGIRIVSVADAPSLSSDYGGDYIPGEPTQTFGQEKNVDIQVAKGGRVTASGYGASAISLAAYRAAPIRTFPVEGGLFAAAAPGDPVGLNAQITIDEGAYVGSARDSAIRETSFQEYAAGGLDPARIKTSISLAGTIEGAADDVLAVELSSGNDSLRLFPTWSLVGIADGGADYDELFLDGADGTTGEISLSRDDVPYEFTNFDILRKQGDGTWRVTGTTDSDWNVPTFAEAGTLYVDSRNPLMPLTGMSGSRIAGIGSVGSLDLYGLLTPGQNDAEVGTFTATNEVTFRDGAVYEVNLKADGSGDMVRAKSATIGNASVQVAPTDHWEAFRNGRRYVIVDTADGVDGRFSDIAQPSIYLRFEADYSNAKQVALVTVIDEEYRPDPVTPEEPVDPDTPDDLVNPGVPDEPAPENPVTPQGMFERTGGTINQRASASGLDGFNLGNGTDAVRVHNELLLSPSVSAARYAFDQSSGEIHASVQNGLADMSEIFTQAVHRRASAMSGTSIIDRVSGAGYLDTPLLGYAPGAVTAGLPSYATAADLVAPDPEFYPEMFPDLIAPIESQAASAPSDPVAARMSPAIWGSAFGKTSDLESDGNAGRLAKDFGGFALGAELAELQLGSAFLTFGLSAGYVGGSFAVPDRRSRADVESGHVGAYGIIDNGPLLASVAGSVGYHDIETERDIRFGRIDRTAEAHYDATSLGLSGEARYRIPVGNVTVAPLVMGDFTHISTSGATETGAQSLNLAVAGSSETIADAGVGVAVGQSFTLGGLSITTDLTMAYEHGFGGPVDQANRFAGGGQSFVVYSPDRTDDRLRTALDVVVPVSDSFVAKARYDGTFSGKAEEHGGQASVSYRF